MTAGAPDSPREVRPGDDLSTTMTDKHNKRGEKYGVLSTGRAEKLGKTKDADTDADDEESGGA